MKRLKIKLVWNKDGPALWDLFHGKTNIGYFCHTQAVNFLSLVDGCNYLMSVVQVNADSKSANFKLQGGLGDWVYGEITRESPFRIFASGATDTFLRKTFNPQRQENDLTVFVKVTVTKLKKSKK